MSRKATGRRDGGGAVTLPLDWLLERIVDALFYVMLAIIFIAARLRLLDD